MATLTLLEINHDRTSEVSDPEFHKALLRFLHNPHGSRIEDLREFGVRVIETRHHEDEYKLENL